MLESEIADIKARTSLKGLCTPSKKKGNVYALLKHKKVLKKTLARETALAEVWVQKMEKLHQDLKGLEEESSSWKAQSIPEERLASIKQRYDGLIADVWDGVRSKTLTGMKGYVWVQRVMLCNQRVKQSARTAKTIT
jgi:hypothetical protein